MECKCGGSTLDRNVVRERSVVGRFRQCQACGFVSWAWFEEGWTAERIRAEPEPELQTMLL